MPLSPEEIRAYAESRIKEAQYDLNTGTFVPMFFLKAPSDWKALPAPYRTESDKREMFIMVSGLCLLKQPEAVIILWDMRFAVVVVPKGTPHDEALRLGEDVPKTQEALLVAVMPREGEDYALVSKYTTHKQGEIEMRHFQPIEDWSNGSLEILSIPEWRASKLVPGMKPWRG